MKSNVLYKHEKNVHNLKASGEVVPIILKLFNPKSVLDVGCGIGTWLDVFKLYHVNDVFGIDGDYVNRELLFSHIRSSEFKAFDLAKPFDLDRRFDLALCLEVAEHLPGNAAEGLVQSLSMHSDTIIFSAAVPGQWGQNHINEQWPEYWIELFQNNGLQCYDIIRPEIWNNGAVDWWYRQNILVFSKNPVDAKGNKHYNFSVVHPEHFKKKMDYINELHLQIHQLSAKLERNKSSRVLFKNLIFSLLNGKKNKL